MFTLLWTATLIHDQIGFEIAKLTSAITHSVVFQATQYAQMINPGECPCAAEHLHSPLVAEYLDKEGICVFDVHSLCPGMLSFVIQELTSMSVQTETRAAQLHYFSSGLAVTEPLYILKRSLLI